MLMSSFLYIGASRQVFILLSGLHRTYEQVNRQSLRGSDRYKVNQMGLLKGMGYKVLPSLSSGKYIERSFKQIGTHSMSVTDDGKGGLDHQTQALSLISDGISPGRGQESGSGPAELWVWAHIEPGW